DGPSRRRHVQPPAAAHGAGRALDRGRRPCAARRRRLRRRRTAGV
ncbi:MAG: hypothetical protein AVDCRST_MAG67-1157, partial [uncultured Solirubrobacteraceae bacterium]